MKQVFKELIGIFIGCLLFVIGVNFYIIPNMLSEGGIIGISVITHYLFNWPLGVTNLIFNLILILAGFKLFKKKTMYYTLFSVFSSSLLLYLTENTRPLTDDVLLSAVFAGLFVGGGLGLIFRFGGTNGGTTVLARGLNQYLGLSVGNAMLLIDIIIVLSSVFIIGVDKGMYTVISVYIGAKLIDYFVDRMDERAAIFIMSNHADEIANDVLYKMAHGITILDGHGGYSKNEKKILYLVCRKKDILKTKELIKKIDVNAYVTVHQVQEVIRKGYKASMTVQ
ncbi:YitT family protein [Oceanobacillus sojae]|uniref:YitT family protein n=1 Tax=Oceanobacillus sojae TaxID=582851 RepID=UPI0009888F68|nr:YitT family protein [Oceanobacillus sojae]MCT1902099.1 YitT family protein [Oceanobacillus sojae]